MPPVTQPITLTTCTGPAVTAVIPALAALRVAVFRAFPYLYDGDLAYEEAYLQIYATSPAAAVIIARQGNEIVGASTCLPLTHETPNVQAPFLAQGLNPADFFYFGESVLLPAHRGQGAGVAFFNAREAHARAASTCPYACFCAVQRPPDHPARPANYTPLDNFWRNRGYTPDPRLHCEMTWRDVGDPTETPKRLNFWLKPLHGAPLP
jgi:GNAT superfamily N-acetyltransferase